MSNIFITGATGFVGAELFKSLKNNQNDIIVAVRKSKPELNSDQIEVGEIDSITDYADALAGVKTVIHLAARAHIMKDSASDPLEAYRQVNVYGTINLARQAVSAGVKRFIYISSVKVNGESTTNKQPYTESDISAPEDAYGISKYEAETELQKLAEESGLELVIIRPPLVYGPGVKANFLSLIKLSLMGTPLPFRSINNKRSMIYIKNLVDFITLCIEHPKAANQIFLIKDETDVSLNKLVTLIRKSADKPNLLFPLSPAIFKLMGKLSGKQAIVDRLIGDLQIDSSKAHRILGWQPPYTFEEGISDTVKHYQKGN